MKELIDRLTAKAGIDAGSAEKALSIILNFLNREAPADAMQQLLNAIPGSRDLIRAESSGGMMSGFASMMGMGAMGALSELTSAGLSMNQVQIVTKEVIDYARAKVGEDVVGQIVGSIPGLDAFV